MSTIRVKYRPRAYFMPFHMRRQRWAVLVAHRRAGKTVAAVNDIVEKASRNPRENPRYAYIAPFLKQAKDIAWMYLKAAAAPYSPKISESGLYVELTALPNSPRITIYGADNPDSFRGLYLDGVVLDEFGDMLGSIFQEILLPALIDRNGWIVFMGTPKGPNHFRDMFYDAKDDKDWHVSFLPHNVTNVIPPEAIAQMKKLMDEEQFAQEMLCSFEASIRGAIYARQMEAMDLEGRIGDFAYDKYTPVDVFFDLGFSDTCVMGFPQRRPDGLLMGHSHGDNLKPAKHYIKYVKEFWGDNKLRPGQVWLPHDARARSLQTGKSVVEQFRDANLRPKIVPMLDIWDGIDATRTNFENWYFNRDGNKTLVLAMKSYHRKYDEKLKIFVDEPVHDWSSHWGDMFRYANIVYKPSDPVEFARMRESIVAETTRNSELATRRAAPVHYPFCLDDLWDTAPHLRRDQGRI